MSSVVVPETHPLYARRNDSGHYTWKGVKHPSVTTVLNLPEEHLLIWYASMTAKECADIIARKNRRELTEDEADDKILNVESTKMAAIRYRDHKAAIGSLVHHAIYEWALGVKFTDLLGYLEGEAIKLCLVNPAKETDGEPYSRTLAREARHYAAGAFEWIDNARPEFEAIGHEAVIISETHGYAGTTDAIAVINGVRTHLDFKTSKNVNEKKWRMQIEAYRRADFIGLVADGSEHPIPPTDQTGVLWIKPMESAELLRWEPSDELYEGFLSARHLYGIFHEMPKPNARKRATTETKDRYCPGF